MQIQSVQNYELVNSEVDIDLSAASKKMDFNL